MQPHTLMQYVLAALVLVVAIFAFYLLGRRHGAISQVKNGSDWQWPATFKELAACTDVICNECKRALSSQSAKSKQLYAASDLLKSIQRQQFITAKSAAEYSAKLWDMIKPQ